MTTRAQGAMFIALVTIAGCVTVNGGARVPVSKLLPSPKEIGPDTTGRMAPWIRITNWEARYRGGVGRNEPSAMYMPEYDGPAALVYPASSRPAAAWGLVQIGDDFRQAGDHAGATRAYWASLTLLSRTFASRSDKARIRAEAFRGLAASASARGQAKWSEMLSLSAKLSDAYLATEQATADDDEFARKVRKWRNLALDHEQAQSDLDSKQMWAGIAQALSQRTESNSIKKGDLAGSIALTQKQLAEQEQLKQEFDAGRQQLVSSMQRYTSQAASFKSTVANDATEVEAGNSFFSDEVVYYLATATDDAPYRELLSRFAADKPAIKQALNAHPGHGEEDLMPIGLAARDYELAVVREERSELLRHSADARVASPAGSAKSPR